MHLSHYCFCHQNADAPFHLGHYRLLVLNGVYWLTISGAPGVTVLVFRLSISTAIAGEITTATCHLTHFKFMSFSMPGARISRTFPHLPILACVWSNFLALARIRIYVHVAVSLSLARTRLCVYVAISACTCPYPPVRVRDYIFLHLPVLACTCTCLNLLALAPIGPYLFIFSCACIY